MGRREQLQTSAPSSLWVNQGGGWEPAQSPQPHVTQPAVESVEAPDRLPFQPPLVSFKLTVFPSLCSLSLLSEPNKGGGEAGWCVRATYLKILQVSLKCSE